MGNKVDQFIKEHFDEIDEIINEVDRNVKGLSEYRSALVEEFAEWRRGRLESDYGQ